MGSHLPSNDPLHVQDALVELFDRVLEKLADTDVFSQPTAPSIFIVYAHDNDAHGIANAHYARQFIKWLQNIRSRTLSDRSLLPVLSTREEGVAATMNILDNQFCLLPGHGGPHDPRVVGAVDKVVVCGSEVLRHYCENSFTSSYMEMIEDSYKSGLEQPMSGSVQDRIRKVVEANCKHNAFHHVLTELALVRLRKRSSPRNQLGIIPVALSGGRRILSFLEECDLVLKLKESPPDQPPKIFDLHRLFFSLLELIYTEEQPLIKAFKDCYERSNKKFQEHTSIERRTFEDIVNREMYKAFRAILQLGSAAVRDIQTQNRLRYIMQSHSETERIYARRTNVLSSLSSVPYKDRKDRNPERVDGTCEWFTTHSLFNQWRDSKQSSLLWVSADPGCGKSVLAKHLVDAVLPSSHLRTTCYFFFKDDFEDQRNLEAAFCSLLHQIFIQKEHLLSNDILKSFEQDRQVYTSFASLWEILTRVSSDKDAGEIVCILDALDECTENGRSQLVRSLEKLYTQEEDKNVLKFLLTSRPYGHIQRGFQLLEDRIPTIHLSGDAEIEVEMISKEIGLVIKAKMEETTSRLKLQEEEAKVILLELTSTKNRTYLWVSLIFDLINESDQTQIGHLQSLIRKADSVSKAYEKILNSSSCPEKAKKLLQIVVAAERPLSIEEMATALAVEKHYKFYDQLKIEPIHRFRKYVRDLCGLFVTIVDSKIYLIHQTAREFLVREPDLSGSNMIPKWQHSLDLMESDLVLAEVCMWYLLLDGSHQAFLHYAAVNWTFHFREASRTKGTELMHQAVLLCDTGSYKYARWFGILYREYDEAESFPGSFTSLMVASYCGLEEVVLPLLLKSKPKLNLRDNKFRRSALSWACYNGHEGVVKLLLLGRITNKQFVSYGLPKRSRYQILKAQLFGKRVHINCRSHIGYTPLGEAVSWGRVANVRQLLEKGANIEAENCVGCTPLITAAERGNVEVVRELLDKGANIEAKDKYGCTPLTAAVNHGYVEVVRELLDKGANIEARNIVGETPLIAAAESGYVEGVRKLLDKGANIEAKDRYGHTPLWHAVSKHHDAIVQELVQRGANNKTTDVS
ncbi:hypothetical protein GGR54DRAFT_218280 [Hypoxylon sp. NC1633]|nr:hypothetical protein GGR54DRAFT_218280 [Hypoxylon sp. NC1633]